MVDINALHSGDRVRIVSEWRDGCNDVAPMNEFLGTVMTINTINKISQYAEMYEDDGEWCWYMPAIAEIITDNDDDIDVESFTSEDIIALLM